MQLEVDMKGSICTIAVLFALAAASLWAQGDRGIITGTVNDPSGASMPDALVTAIHLLTNTSYQTSTTASGDFTVPALPVGNLQCASRKDGFQDTGRKQRCGGGRGDRAVGCGDWK